jgi:hypothetical protein
MPGMPSNAAKVRDVVADNRRLVVRLDDGRILSSPLDWYPTLKGATHAERSQWRPCQAGHGIHWPALDYDLSVEGLLRGAREAGARHGRTATKEFRAPRSKGSPDSAPRRRLAAV